MKVNKRRKFTGKCDFMSVDPDSHQPRLLKCGKPGRFYKPEEVGMFGIFACDECFTRKYGQEE